MNSEITAALIGIVSALITAFITKSTADKKNAIENITQERKKWRDDLRGATIALRRYFENKDRFCNKGNETDGKENCGIVFHSAAEAKAFFEVRLNLGDPEDCKLMAILDRLVTHDCSSRKPTFQKWEAESKENGLETEKLVVEDLLAHYEEGMSHNLKYDWERAKKEVKGNGLPIWFILIVFLFVLNFCNGCCENPISENKPIKESISLMECSVIDNDDILTQDPIPYKITWPQNKSKKNFFVYVEKKEVKSDAPVNILYKYKCLVTRLLVCLILFILLNNLRRYFCCNGLKFLSKSKCKLIKDLFEYSPRTELFHNKKNSPNENGGKTPPKKS